MAQPINNHYMLTNGGSPQQATSYVIFSIDLVPDSLSGQGLHYLVWYQKSQMVWLAAGCDQIQPDQIIGKFCLTRPDVAR